MKNFNYTVDEFDSETERDKYIHDKSKKYFEYRAKNKDKYKGIIKVMSRDFIDNSTYHTFPEIRILYQIYNNTTDINEKEKIKYKMEFIEKLRRVFFQKLISKIIESNKKYFIEKIKKILSIKSN